MVRFCRVHSNHQLPLISNLLGGIQPVSVVENEYLKSQFVRNCVHDDQRPWANRSWSYSLNRFGRAASGVLQTAQVDGSHHLSH